ncbi:MAG: peptide chain release factor N(5)-glutamine methyltransferase [Acidobacteria bacterium]|nr:peptide chain release factor N(5)-glutamine methyltransferase [Acidobacteriota bacterium]
MQTPVQTIASARARMMGEFGRAGVESPALTADLLIGFALGWSRERVLAHPERELGPEAGALLDALAARRVRGEPLQYLTGEREFYGRPFRVTPDVLIPRPETEILVEEAIGRMRSLGRPDPRYADVGTGSGCIALSVACEFPESFGYGVDRSFAALRVAAENAVRLGAAGRVAWVAADLLECFPDRGCLDFILSNPPYVPSGDYNDLPREVREYEPRIALFGGDDGLDVYRSLIPAGAARLVPGGELLLEVGRGQAAAVGRLMEEAGLRPEAAVRDLQGIARVVIARRPGRRTHG